MNLKTVEGYSPIIVAASEGYQEIVELLIANGADVNAKDDEGRSALSMAMTEGNDQMAELLKKHGAQE